MGYVIKRAVLGALLLAIMPLAVLFSGWLWKPDGSSIFLHICYWVTETASYPWAGISCVVLAFWFLWLLRPSYRQSFWLLIVLAVAVLSGQAIKSAVKESVEEPRPFVVWLEDEYKVDDEYFYGLPRKERSEIVRQQLADDTRVPNWLKSHWERETGYAFPSGHTLFTTTWALLGIVLLWPRKRYFSIVLLVSWSTIVAGSRLMLGMHWPLDLLLATLLSGIIAVIVGWVTQRYQLIPLNISSHVKEKT
jgi:phosphatidylglycerophosphatase B